MANSRGWAWDKAAAICRARARATNTPCARCGKPFDWSLVGNHPLACTAGHIDGLEWSILHPLDPRRTNPNYLQPEHRSCGASHGATFGNRRRHTARTVSARPW